MDLVIVNDDDNDICGGKFSYNALVFPFFKQLLEFISTKIFLKVHVPLKDHMSKPFIKEHLRPAAGSKRYDIIRNDVEM